LTLCRNIGYEQMRLPNLLEHETMREVNQQASSWVRLVAVRCHPDTQVNTTTTTTATALSNKSLQ